MKSSRYMGKNYQVLNTLQKGGGIFATVRVVDLEGKKAVLKNYDQCSFLIRWFGAPVLSLLEHFVYRQLAEVEGIPKYLGSKGWGGIFIEYIQARNCREVDPSELSQPFFMEAGQLMGRVRKTGVLHCDVAGNLMVGEDGHPYLLDFTSCIFLPSWLGPLKPYFVQMRKKYDDRVLLKLKRRRVPHLLLPGELSQSKSKFPNENWIQLLEKVLRKCTRLVGRKA